MSTNARIAVGTVLNRWDDASSGWEEIVEVTHISWDGISREAIEIANLNTPDEYVNAIQGMLNANSMTATISYTKAQFIQLKKDIEHRGTIMYQVVFPDGEGIEFEGFIMELPLDLATDAQMGGDVVFRIDGKADFVSAIS